MSSSRAPKGSLSGLKSVSRDWSDAKSSQELTDIYWPPTPERKKPELSAAQKRLKDIQEALAGMSGPPVKAQSQPLTTSRVFNKRPSSESVLDNDDPPAKKARQLPASWAEEPLSSATAFVHKISSSSSRSRAVPEPESSASAAKGNVASVFLSKEQTQILKLVQDEHSLFYTGSAGMLPSSRIPLLPCSPGLLKEPESLSFFEKS